jgi:tetraprenyl-beta-curcumene synthase
MQHIRFPKNAPQFLYRLFRHVLPVARQEIRTWTHEAQQIPDHILREQAIASLKHKRFHADGGSVYAAVNLLYTQPLVRLIVALQTISDYLDNLCDRCETYDEEDFHQLHHAMRDAVRPDNPIRPYYALRGNPMDGGYLANLVTTCQNEIRKLPGYSTVETHVHWLIDRYCELQAYKHIEPQLRRSRLETWWKTYEPQYPQIEWWEFAAAAGSTLGVFSLFLTATNSLSPEDAKEIFEGYFPYVCGLHILLDYLIDLEEDREEGDFNFVQCYASPAVARERIRHFARESWQRSRQLAGGLRIHRDVVRGLLGMYLSDAKVNAQRDVRPTKRLLWEFGPTAWAYYGACVVYRLVR